MRGDLDLGHLEDGTPARELVNNFLRRCASEGVRLEAAVVIGSRVEKRWKAWSDVDLLLLVAEGEDIKRVVELAYEEGVEPRAYLKEGVLGEAARGNIAVLDAMDHGVPVYGLEAWEKLKAGFSALKKRLGIRKIRDGWVIGSIERRALSARRAGGKAA